MIVTGLPIVMVFALITALLLNRKFAVAPSSRHLFLARHHYVRSVLTQLVQETDAMRLQMNYGILKEYFYYFNGRLFVLFMDNLVRTLWFSGVQIMVFLAVLQKIDRSMYEAASIDGATAWEMFWRITLPHLPLGCRTECHLQHRRDGVGCHRINECKNLTHLLEVNRPYSYSAAMAWIYALAQLLLMGITAVVLMEKKGRRRA